jgi:class 3 adenylate cyclase
VLQRHGGYLAQSLGDGLLVYFGYPTAHEDDARRGTVNLFAQTPAQEQARGDVSECFLQAAKAGLVISCQLSKRWCISRRYVGADN